jgi:hypothetical protein
MVLLPIEARLLAVSDISHESLKPPHHPTVGTFYVSRATCFGPLTYDGQCQQNAKEDRCRMLAGMLSDPVRIV